MITSIGRFTDSAIAIPKICFVYHDIPNLFSVLQNTQFVNEWRSAHRHLAPTEEISALSTPICLWMADPVLTRIIVLNKSKIQYRLTKINATVQPDGPGLKNPAPARQFIYGDRLSVNRPPLGGFGIFGCPDSPSGSILFPASDWRHSGSRSRNSTARAGLCRRSTNCSKYPRFHRAGYSRRTGRSISPEIPGLS